MGTIYLWGDAMEYDELKFLFGRLKGIRELLNSDNPIYKETGDDYNSIVKRMSEVLSEDLGPFLLQDYYFDAGGRGRYYCDRHTLAGKLVQLISSLEYGFNLGEKVVEIGSIYNSIFDQDLKSRCSDILTAPGNFDRVINQATLVLEERIREKSEASGIGTQLVNNAINTDINKSILVITGSQDEHEGVGHICRGIMMAFRNPTHHYITDSYTREDALKVCAFIDILLKIVDKAKKNRL